MRHLLKTVVGHIVGVPSGPTLQFCSVSWQRARTAKATLKQSIMTRDGRSAINKSHRLTFI